MVYNSSRYRQRQSTAVSLSCTNRHSSSARLLYLEFLHNTSKQYQQNSSSAMDFEELAAMAVSPERKHHGGSRRRWLPFRIRLPLPGLGGSTRIPSGRHVPSAHKHKAGGFATATVAMSDCIAAPPSAPSHAAPAAAAGSAAKVATKPASDVLAGALARAASQGTIHPLDTLKVRLQASSGGAAPLSKFAKLVPPPAAGSGSLQLRAMGTTVASLYKGVFGAASGAGIAIGAYFAFYGVASNVVSRNTNLAPGAVAFVSGAVAAAGSSVVKVPLAVCIRSVQAGVYPNVFSAARSITSAAGVRGLFTGYAPTLLEDVPDMAVKFATFETMRSVHRSITGRPSPSPQEDFAMGAVAGALAAAATTPLDVIKTRMMCTAASRPTMAVAARAVYAQGGMPAFLTGVGPRALSNGLNSAIFFLFFSALSSSLKQRAAADKAAKAAARGSAEDGFMHSSSSDADTESGFGVRRRRSGMPSLLSRATPLQLDKSGKVCITVQALGSSDLASCTVTEEEE